jgi:hypothetical protein
MRGMRKASQGIICGRKNSHILIDSGMAGSAYNPSSDVILKVVIMAILAGRMVGPFGKAILPACGWVAGNLMAIRTRQLRIDLLFIHMKTVIRLDRRLSPTLGKKETRFPCQ